MKVLHVITGLGIGGAERQLRLLVKHLPPDVRCEVATLSEPGAVAEELGADGVPVTHLGMTGNRDVTVLPGLVSLIRNGRFDVVHTHLYRACVYGRVAARLAGVRAVVATEHSLGATQIEGRPLRAGTRALYRATERLGSGTLAVSDTVARRLAAWGVPEARVHVVPNGIEPARFAYSPAAGAAARARLGIPAGAYVVGGVGRLVRGKNFDGLIRAVAAVPDTYLVIAGDGPERVPLLRTVHQIGFGGRFRLAPPCEEPGSESPTIPELLSALDLFVSPSPEESFGLALVEALAAGLPALYVACPAVEDLPPQDAPGAHRVKPYELAAAVREERQAPPRRLPVPPAVARYDMARTAARVAELYAAVLAEAAPASNRPTGDGATVPVPQPAAPRPAIPSAPTKPRSSRRRAASGEK